MVHGHNDSLSGAFQASAIEVACALKSMVSDYEISEEDLRAHYKGVNDELILRIIDTLHVYRFDWMEDANTKLEDLMRFAPRKLHMQILDEAQDIAFARLKHIGFLQGSDQYMHDLENDIISEGQDRFPELYDASPEAEDITCKAIDQIAVLRHKLLCPKPANDAKLDKSASSKQGHKPS